MLKSAIFAAILGSLAAAVLLDSAVVSAQERAPIRGRVKDSTTGKPVSAATVFNQETGDATVTDDDGNFELPSRTDGPGRLLVIDPSYQNTEVHFDGTTAVSIALDPISLGGEEIVIQEERVREVAGETTMRREEIVRVPGARGDALAAVKNLPGVANTQGFGPNAGLVIRGSSPADSRIFVDGFEIPILYHLGGIQS